VTQTQLLLLPAFVQVALTIYVLYRAGSGKVSSVRQGLVKSSDIDGNKNAFPETVRKFAANYQNQFELPVLYYVLLALVIIAGLVDGVFVALSWAFVATRLAHSFVQTGKNVIATRFKVFTAGLVFLILLWSWFGLRLFVIG